MSPVYSRCAFACLTLALLTGCGSSQVAIATPPGNAQITGDSPDRPWISPEANGEDLLYVATGSDVYILSYPSGNLVGDLHAPGYGLCSDKNGDVFVLGVGYTIVEYAHGTTSPLQVLDDGDIPVGCAVDPISGNLAVTNESSASGGVLIYPNAQEPARGYGDSEIAVFGLCGYDNDGNLFFAGKTFFDGSGYLAELPRNGDTIKNFKLGPKLYALGSVQWDGSHITLSNPSTDEIFRLSLGKSSVKIAGVTHLRAWQAHPSNSLPYVQTWIQDGAFLGQTTTHAEVGVWSYPAGGIPAQVISGFTSGSATISGITISVAPAVSKNKAGLAR